MAFFVGIVDGQDEVWGVRIPDVPGCFGGGATAEAAVLDATSALCDMADEANVVSARSMTEIARDPSAAFNPGAGESLVLIPFLAESGVPARANISVDQRQLEAIDAAAKVRGLTRSAFLVSAAIEKIAAGG